MAAKGGYITCFLIALLLYFTHAVEGCGSPKYTAITPGEIKAGESIEILFYLCNEKAGSSSVTVEVRSGSVQGAVVKSLSTQVTTNSTNSLSIMSETAWSGSYYVSINHSSLESAAMLTVEVMPDKPSILVQTDKAVYKPSQMVRMRILTIDGDLRGKNSSLDVYVEDPNGNKVRQYLDRYTGLGMIQLDFTLTSKPILGDWTIRVSAERYEEAKHFKVDEYVLPKFEVTVTLPSYVLTSATSIPIDVAAKYTYGEDVIGTLSLKVYTDSKTVVLSSGQINGTKTVMLSSDNIRALGFSSALDSTKLSVIASVKDSLSEVTLTGNGLTKISANAVVVEWLEINSDSYRPGGEYAFFVKVAKPDGQPINDASATVALSITSSYDYGDGITNYASATGLDIPESGVIRLSFTPSADANENVAINVVATVNNVEYSMKQKSVGRFRTSSSDNQLRHLALNTAVTLGSLQVNSDLSYDVACSDGNAIYQYIVLSRGKIVKSGSAAVSDGTQSLTIEQSFTPRVTLLVYGIIDGELLADSITYGVEGLFKNSIEVEFQNSDGSSISSYVEPGTDIKLKVTTETDSLVGLLAVDQSTRLLGTGNDITQSQVQDMMLSMLSADDDDDSSSCGGPVFWWSFPSAGGGSSGEVFQSAGLKVVTDFNYEECYPYEEIMYAMFDDVAGNAGPVGTAVEESTPEPSVMIRQEFPEVFVWNMFNSESADTYLDLTVPDTITTWVATGISLHPTKGLGITSTPSEVLVKLPFFISPVLPYNAVKGEQLQLKIILSNYGDQEETCQLTVPSSTGYLLRLTNNGTAVQGQAATTVTLAQGATTVREYWIEPSMIGTINITAQAVCDSGKSDAFLKELLVKPTGFTEEQCQSVLAELPQSSTYQNTFTIKYPSNAVTDSHYITVITSGDIMGQSIDGLDRLISQPTGCGEQNMITLVPSIFVHKYLDAVNEAQPEIKEKTMGYMEMGYQRELNYKHDDGAFSAFGNSDPSGSTWLTAFVLRCFRQASEFIAVDSAVLSAAQNWIKQQISSSGAVNEPGRVIHTEMQSGTGSDETLAAFVVISFLEDDTNNQQAVTDVQQVVSYLENSFDKIENSQYSLALVSYALSLAGSNQASKFFTKFETYAIDGEGMRYWEPKPIRTTMVQDDYDHSPVSSSGAIEISSYALLTYINNNDLINAKMVAKWLAEQRNSFGGYYSTQDTILALQALSVYAAALITPNTNLNIQFDTGSETFSHTITQTNAIITKKHFFMDNADSVSSVDVTMNGIGNAILSVCTAYNIQSRPTANVLNITSSIANLINTNIYQVEACGAYTGSDPSGMTLMEIKPPTGYSTSVNDWTGSSGANIAMVEIDNNGMVAVYFNEMNGDKSCITINMTQDMLVDNIQDSYVTAQQYYNPATRVQEPYNPTNASQVTAFTSETGNGSNYVELHILIVLISIFSIFTIFI